MSSRVCYRCRRIAAPRAQSCPYCRVRITMLDRFPVWRRLRRFFWRSRRR